MAVLPETLRRFLSDLSEVEQHKYWTIYGEDLDTEIACKNAGHQWNPDTDSSAIRYLQNLKKRKELQLEKDQPAAALVKNGIRATLRNDGQDRPDSNSDEVQSSAVSSRISVSSKGSSEESQEMDPISTASMDKESCTKSSSSESENNSSNENDTDCESQYDDCRSVTSYCKKLKKGLSSGTFADSIKKIQESSFRKIRDLNEGGLFEHIESGYIHRELVKVKTLHKRVQETESNRQTFETIQKIFQLEHRNLIKMLALIEVGSNKCQKFVYASEETELSLLQYLRSKDKADPRGYATFGKFSFDIINACEYLHSKGVVHGCLSARSVTVRKAYRSYGRGEPKLHLNSFVSDYGIIHLDAGVENGEFYKASNGKLVHLRWTPKELLEVQRGGAGCKIAHSFESDVWSFGVLLWELWTGGRTPFGAKKPKPDIERAILMGSSPMTFEKPVESCPKHILDVMKSILTPDPAERPTFSDLKIKFDEFRQHRFQHAQKNKRQQENEHDNLKLKPKSAYFKRKANATTMAPSTSSAPPVPVHALTQYERVREWRNQAHSASAHAPRRSSFPKADYKAQKPEVTVALVPVPMQCLPGTDFMNGLHSRNRNQAEQLAQALSALNIIVREPQNSGSNSVNVNIQSQDFPKANGTAPSQANAGKKGQHGQQTRPQKRVYYNKKKNAKSNTS